MDLSGKVAIVTGATSGIGAATVKALHDIRMKVIKVDLSNEKEFLDCFAWVARKIGPIHVLINNAGPTGLTPPSSVITGDIDTWKKIMVTNYNNILLCCREAVKNMQDNGVDGYIINISSIAGIRPLPFPKTSVYSSAKFAIRGMTENLKMELGRMGSKIRTTCLHHGVAKTEVYEISGLSKRVTEELLFEDKPYLLSEDIANTITFLVQSPQHVQVSTLTVQAVGEMM